MYHATLSTRSTREHLRAPESTVLTLFSESASRVVVSTSPEDLEVFLAKAKAAGVPAELIGRTGGTRIAIEVAGADGLDISVADAEQVWAHALERYFD